MKQESSNPDSPAAILCWTATAWVVAKALGVAFNIFALRPSWEQALRKLEHPPPPLFETLPPGSICNVLLGMAVVALGWRILAGHRRSTWIVVATMGLVTHFFEGAWNQTSWQAHLSCFESIR